MSDVKKRKSHQTNGHSSKSIAVSAELPRGALDDIDHWWLPPAHVRRELRTYLPRPKIHRAVLLLNFSLLLVVLMALCTTILEPLYPPSTSEEKLVFGVVYLATDGIGAILNFALLAELWFWMLAFGVGWWANKANVAEFVLVVADLAVRMWYPGPVEVARCLYLVVLLRILVRMGKYAESIKQDTMQETIRLIKEREKSE